MRENHIDQPDVFLLLFFLPLRAPIDYCILCSHVMMLCRQQIKFTDDRKRKRRAKEKRRNRERAKDTGKFSNLFNQVERGDFTEHAEGIC